MKTTCNFQSLDDKTLGLYIFCTFNDYAKTR
jgi:hypothetical protein